FQGLSGGDTPIITEPALTNIGIVLPDEGYLQGVREITRKYDVLLVNDETHTICAGPGGATRAWELEPDFVVIGKPIGGGIPVAAYGMSEAVADRLNKPMLGHEIDVAGVGGTLTGSALAMAAVRATLSTALRDEDFAITIPLAQSFTQGVSQVIADYELPWHVQRLGCRAEYWFCPPPRNGAQAAAAVDEELDAFMHLWTVNRGVLLAPFHNMSLFAPMHTQADVDAHTDAFRGAVSALVG
ncbi:MAG TPA: aminotransferase class III-fold pyridoxal phosphate-dependent enzyme, partial [Marmoricola sp.]|nr:aminotransferase class III-fold pyridoxal phosphate-dependent enzyme [Marmoricola sp.]